MERSLTTGEDGAYQFQSVGPGTYKLTIEAQHFITFERRLIFRPGAQKRVDAALEYAMITGLMVVTAPDSPLARAVWEEDLTELKYLLAEGVDVNARDSSMDITALGVAVSNGKLEFVRALIEAGADPNARGYDGRTPLMRLDEDATAEIVGALVAAGAKLNLKDEEGNTALHVAAALEKSEVLRALLDAGAKADAGNGEGVTPLMVAAESGRVENVKVLLLAGADPNRTDKEGETALKLAADNEEVLELLRAYGAYR